MSDWPPPRTFVTRLGLGLSAVRSALCRRASALLRRARRRAVDQRPSPAPPHLGRGREVGVGEGRGRIGVAAWGLGWDWPRV